MDRGRRVTCSVFSSLTAHIGNDCFPIASTIEDAEHFNFIRQNPISDKCTVTIIPFLSALFKAISNYTRTSFTCAKAPTITAPEYLVVAPDLSVFAIL